MKYKELLEAKIIQAEVDVWDGEGVPVTLYVNPTAAQLRNIKTRGGLDRKHYRAMYLQNNTFMLWDAYQAAHNSVWHWFDDNEEYPDAETFVQLELEFNYYIDDNYLTIEFDIMGGLGPKSLGKWKKHLLGNPTFLRMVKDFNLRWETF